MSRKQALIILFAILLFAALLRLWGLSRGDLLNDEATYAFRAVGLLDYFRWSSQETPLAWFDPGIPSWTKFSFHDHPPLVFLIQHFFIRLFGENVIAFRLPSVLFGVASVLFLYLVARRFFSYEAALIAAGLFAVNVNHVFISRVGMQESYVIFFMLASIFFFLKALGRDSYFLHAGIAVGLALLTKYTAVILFPIFGLYLLLVRPRLFLNKKLWFGFCVALAVFSPVIIYNLELYRATGYLDFQFSTVFGPRPEAWRVAPGKEIGTFLERAGQFIPNLIAGNSWVFLSLFASAFVAFLVGAARNFSHIVRRYLLLIVSLPFVVLLLLVIGPSNRFLTMLTPFIAIAVGVFMYAFYQKFLWRFPKAALILLIVVFAFEIFYTVNNQIRYYSVGLEPWLASRIRYENYNAGNRELSAWIENELENKVPAFVLYEKFGFLRRIQEKAVAEAEAEGRAPYPAAIVLYGNFDQGERMWSFDRLLVYHGWPVIPFSDYGDMLRVNGFDYLFRTGFRHVYFVVSTNFIPSPDFFGHVEGVEPASIQNKKGDEAFKIYRKIL
ncbi:MAG: glycosyltransferase family 39 protein [Candidatus Sungbacteria bacterium]|nr:glycosyltransferase family 39 protein [Candidatus Sungbacteria bacterium]